MIFGWNSAELRRHLLPDLLARYRTHHVPDRESARTAHYIKSAPHSWRTYWMKVSMTSNMRHAPLAAGPSASRGWVTHPSQQLCDGRRMCANIGRVTTSPARYLRMVGSTLRLTGCKSEAYASPCAAYCSAFFSSSFVWALFENGEESRLRAQEGLSTPRLP